MPANCDALLVLSFGGPEKMADVMPFLENVLRGTSVPRQRMLEVAAHYEQFGGVSPINAQNRALITALTDELALHGPALPVYWGNRNWHPLLEQTLRRMATDGVRRALAFVTAAYSSYSTCRQYLGDLERARQAVGPAAPRVDKLRAFFNHPGFIEPQAERVRAALQRLPGSRPRLVFTAHSIPTALADTCRYAMELEEASRLVCERVEGHDHAHDLVFQSRSGPPQQPWLEPDVCDHLQQLHGQGVRQVVLVPIGFICDHLEVIYDLDTQAVEVADRLGLSMVRAATVGTHPRFVSMVRELIVERLDDQAERPALGRLGPAPDVCPADCCPPPRRRPTGTSAR